MALEKSVLDEAELRDILANAYGLHLVEPKRLALGSANCYKARCDEGVFFVKEYQSEYDMDRVKKEAELVAYLRAQDFPVAKFILTTDGRSCISVHGRTLAVQEFVDGQCYLNDLPRRYRKDCAKYLGMLHRILKDYPMETSMDEKWVEIATSANASEKIDALLAVLEEYKDDLNYERIREDLRFKKELSAKIAGMRSYYKGITYTPSHGDYTACQLICDDERVRAVIDFTTATKLPAVWELMRSYVQSFGACQNGAPFDVEDFCDYVNEYRKYFELTEWDLEAMPYVYLVQLARSSYGYKEYLVQKTENRDALLEFATWRTGVCREVYTRIEEISAALVRLAKERTDL